MPNLNFIVIYPDKSYEYSIDKKKTTQTLYNINIVHTLVKTITHEQGN